MAKAGMSPSITPQQSTAAPLVAQQVDLGTVGHLDQAGMPEGTPAWMRFEQGEILVEVTARDGDQIIARVGVPSGSLRFGQQVVLAYPDGDPALAVIVGFMHDANNPAPTSVAGVATGIDVTAGKGEATEATTMHFLRLPDGRALAFQTQGTGDILLHSGSAVHVRCSADNAIHLDGRVALGVAPSVRPITSSVAPQGREIPGSPAAAHVPEPYAQPSPPVINLPSPYVGFQDSIVRAHDAYQITAATDPGFFTWISGVASAAGYPDPAPAAITALISGQGGPGSKHTASD